MPAVILPLCAAPACLRLIEGTPAGGGKPAATSFGYFSWQDKKSNLLPGNPRRLSSRSGEPFRKIRSLRGSLTCWIPACAGMTKVGRAKRRSGGLHPQGVRRGCRGRKPQQHTQRPRYHCRPPAATRRSFDKLRANGGEELRANAPNATPPPSPPTPSNTPPPENSAAPDDPPRRGACARCRHPPGHREQHQQ